MILGQAQGLWESISCRACPPGAFSPHRLTASLAITPLGRQDLQLCWWQALGRKANVLDQGGKENPRRPKPQIEAHTMGFNMREWVKHAVPTKSTAQGQRRETGLEMGLTGSSVWTHKMTRLSCHLSLHCSPNLPHPTYPAQTQLRFSHAMEGPKPG